MRTLLATCLIATSVFAAPDDKVDLAVLHSIKREAFTQSKVMEHLFYLTDVNGPRLTNSAGYVLASEWAVKTLKGYGASNARLEKWGEFGRGWSYSRFSLNLVAPTSGALEALPKAWSGGTSGRVVAPVVYAPIALKGDGEVRQDLGKLAASIDQYAAKWRGKLKGKFVLTNEPREFEPSTRLAFQRLDDTKLGDMTRNLEPTMPVPYEWPLTGLSPDAKVRERMLESLPDAVIEEYYNHKRAVAERINDFYLEEGVAGVLSTDGRGEGGVVFAEGLTRYNAKTPASAPTIVLAPEGYNRLCRLVEHKIETKIELELQAQFNDTTTEAFNVIAELPGGSKKNEIVMLGAHLDSWHGATGATDNAAGVAIAMEAFRILKTLKLDRTVRLALWSGEEQGTLGSHAYVQQHFADPVTMKLKPEHALISAYFNADHGSGKIRGIYAQGNDMIRPTFEAWLAPFREYGASTVTLHGTPNTDHMSFDAVGVPGFQFIQDPLEYFSRSHHSALDVYDRAQPGDLMQAAAVMATFVYQAANRAELLPRKPVPKPLPPRRAQ